MKMPMAWHRECLANYKKSLQQQEDELSRVEARVGRTRADVRFYEMQIQEAAEKRKDGFDSDKFCKKVAFDA